MEESKKIVVTGGAGFIGSHLCERLLAPGHEVICVDNFYTGRKANIAHLRDHPRFDVVRHDITEPLVLQADEVYNLACPASPGHYQADPIHTMKTSVLGSINLLGLARRTGAKSLLASTSEVYGDPLVHPQPESYWGHVNPCGVRSCYDEGKRSAEALYFDYHRQHGIPIKVVRIFNTYGPRMRPDDGRVVSNFIVQALMDEPLTIYGGRVVSNFTVQARRDEPLTIYGDGQQTRSFCYVDDLVDGLIRMMASPPEVLGPINLGNPGEFTVLELAQAIKHLTNSRSPIVHEPLPRDDPKRRQPDITRARTVLGWQPMVQLEQGLLRTIAYFEAQLSRGQVQLVAA